MSQLYRFKFSSDHFAVELESTDQHFIDQKMRELINWSIEQGGSTPRLLQPGKPAYQPAQPAPNNASPQDSNPTVEEDSDVLDATLEQVVDEPKPKPKPKPGKPKSTTRKTAKTKRKRGPKPGTRKTAGKASKAKATADKGVEDIEEVIDPKRIVEVAKNSDRYKTIKKNILDKSNQLNRILLAFHYARATYGDRGFSSGTIEEVTKGFGKVIRRSNIAAQIKNNSDLFDADQEPRRGVTVKYELTPKGRSTIEELIKK